ncbi:hypothetical protein KUTeg_010100 [Tegillarca granosa]|uniref:RBR-type E3 ubiquitin transferase n=1 Tax=Tegillarca granosa TaxID=220873 RepID=A0ABQ9F5R7_TEGGR|nr:hypothetical protein KUTeg_010100 [Tegillarca granosa]
MKAIDDNKITDLGRWIAKLPVDPKFGVLIYEGLKHGVCIEAMVIAACAGSSSIFYRSGTDQEKQKADCLKVRFCRPAGDLLTMFSVFREWHQQPERTKGPWCFENSINGKAITGVRENVNEIRKILQHEMKESVKFDLADPSKVEEILIELIFKVLKPNICHYLGHQKAGYLAVNKDQFVQIHPSSALLPLGGYPEWMVFQQILKTSREFALVITPVSEELVKKAVDEGQLHINIQKTKEKKVKEIFSGFVGSQHFREFVGPRFTNLRKLEDELKTLCVNSVVVIDADRDWGTVKVYTSPRYQSLIDEIMKTTLYPIRDAFLLEEVEEPIINDNNSVRALIGAGGCVKHIYMPDEFQTVKIHCCVKDTADLSESDVTNFFKQYGSIKNCNKYKFNAKFPSLWGQVTFQSTESAIKAVKETVGNPDISAKSVGKFTNSRDAFRTKITWCRRESRGFGFVELKNIEDLPIVTRCGSIMVGGSSARVSCAKNSPNQVYVGKFNQFVTEDVLRQSVADAAGLHPENDLAKINIARSRVVTTPEMLDTYKRRLCAKIEEYAPKGQYSIELRTPTDAAVMYTAFVSFKNPEEGNIACKEMDLNFLLQGAVVHMKADLKSSMFVHKRIYEKSKAEIAECITYLEDANPTVKLKTKEMKSGNVIIDLHTDCVEDLARAKGILHEIVKGDTIDSVFKPSVKYLFTRNGRQKLETIMKNTDTIIINDYRVMTVSVHGLRTNRQKAFADIQKYLDEISHGVLKQIELKGNGKPSGVMKKLMETYGSDLTQFVTETKLASAEIEQRSHRLKIVGPDDAVQEGLKIINGIISKLSDDEIVSNVELPDCSICFCPIENGELYRLESCGHEYCKDCIKRQAEISVTGKDFPLKCSQQDCEASWAWRDLSNVISQGFILKTNLISSAVSCFVTHNKDLYHYCVSPDCPMVYKVTKDGQVFQCPICEIRVCTACHIQSHDGMSCAMYKSLKEDDGSLKVWLQQNPRMRKLCPNCTTPIEKIAGCNKMTCIACKKCICWVCLEFFDDEQKCYGHLQKYHGSFT